MSKNKHKFLTFAALMTGATVAVHFINHTIATAAQLKQMLHISNDNYFEWRFGNIYYTKKGTGSPILLIHDTLPGASGYEWSKIEDELAIDHTVYTVDLLGCGRSDKSSITYTNFVYVQMISDFIKKIIGQKTDVIASGFSGSFVTMACHNEKELFNKIMLVNPPSLTQLKQMPNRKDRLLKAALEIPIFGTLVYHMIVSRDNINNLFIEKMYYNPFHVDNQMADAYYEAAKLMDLKIQGTLGLTQRDVKAVSDIDGVELAEGSYSTDVMSGEDDARKVLHLESISSNFNLLTADEGRIPEKSGEIFLDKPFAKNRGYKIGDTISVSEDGDSELLKKTTYTVVGIGSSPLYISFNRGNTTLGSGEVSGFGYILPEDFDQEAFTQIYIMVHESGDVISYTDAYDNLIRKIQKRVEGIEKETVQPALR